MQVDSYHQYLDMCLKNLTLGKNQKRLLQQHRQQEANQPQAAQTLKSRLEIGRFSFSSFLPLSSFIHPCFYTLRCQV